MTVKQYLLIIGLFLINKPIFSQLVSASYHDFYIEVNKNGINCDSIDGLEVNKKQLQKDHSKFSIFSEFQGVIRNETSTLYAVQVVNNKTDTLCIYFCLSAPLFFERDSFRYGTLVTRKISFEIGELKTGTYFIDLNDKENKTNKRLNKLIKIDKKESTSIDNSTPLPTEIANYYTFNMYLNESHMAGNLLIGVTPFGIAINKISSEAITTEKIEQEIGKEEKSKPISQLLSVFN